MEDPNLPNNEDSGNLIPSPLLHISNFITLLTLVISLVSISFHFSNYRNPTQQRLIIRIQLMIPFFACACFFTLNNDVFPSVIGKILSTFVEIYEAFVIYTFFSLLTVYLGDERDIIIKNSGRAPVKQLMLSDILPEVDISDPFTFLSIKRGILQYVWLKPLICIATTLNELVFHNEEAYLIITIIYNISVSVSLYDLALFWNCLYDQLTPFKPWGKFLNVKLIIFASYWQTLLISILVHFQIINPAVDYQALLMSFELLGFAISHLVSFTYHEYDPFKLQGCARYPYLIAVHDTFGIQDLLYDFKKTLYGSSYDYRSFDSVESVIAHPNSTSRLKRLNHGMRYSGDKKYWLNNNEQTQGVGIKTPLLRRDSINSSIRGLYPQSLKSQHLRDSYIAPTNESIKSYKSISNDFAQQHIYDVDDDPELTALLEEYVHDPRYYKQIRAERPFGDKNSPVVYAFEDYAMSPVIRRLREEVRSRNSV